MSDRSTLSRLFGGSSIIFGGKILGLALGFLGNIIIARFLGATELGTVSLGVLLMSVTTTVALLGTNTGITRYLSRDDSLDYKRAVISQGIRLSFPVSLVLGSAVYLQSEWIALYIFNAPGSASILAIFGIAIPISALHKTFLSAVRGLGRPRPKVYVQNILVPILKTILIGGAVFFTFDEYGVAWAYLIAFSTGAVVLGYYIYATVGFDLSAGVGPNIKQFLKYSTPLMLTALMTMGFVKVDRLFISQFWQTDLVGIYSGVYNFTRIMTVVLISINFMFLPLFSEMHSKENKEEMERLYQSSTKWVVAFSLPIVITFVIYPTTIIRLTYGKEFVGGSLSLIILTIGVSSHIVSGLNRSALKAIGDTKSITVGTAAVFILNILLNLYLVPRFSIEGAAVATTISYFFWNLYYIRVLKRKVKMSIISTRNIILFSCSSLGLAGVAYSTKIVIDHNVISLISFILIGGVMYSAVILFFLITVDDINLLSELNDSSDIDLNPLISWLHNR